MSEMTSEELRAEATEGYQRAVESFERCDTDGWLSQWCHTLMADLRMRQADIIDAGGKSQFIGLYLGERRVAAKLIKTKYGMSWRLREDEQEWAGRAWVPFGPTSLVQKRLGLTERSESAPAWAAQDGMQVYEYRTGDAWGLDAIMILETSGDEQQ